MDRLRAAECSPGVGAGAGVIDPSQRSRALLRAKGGRSLISSWESEAKMTGERRVGHEGTIERLCQSKVD